MEIAVMPDANRVHELVSELGDTDLIPGLIRTLKKHPVALANEKRAQAELNDAVAKAGYPTSREVPLSQGHVADLVVGDGIVVEVKLRGNGKRNIYRQLERYAKHDGVTAIVLVTNVAMGLPETIHGKPAYLVSMGRAWL